MLRFLVELLITLSILLIRKKKEKKIVLRRFEAISDVFRRSKTFKKKTQKNKKNRSITFKIDL